MDLSASFLLDSVCKKLEYKTEKNDSAKKKKYIYIYAAHLWPLTNQEPVLSVGLFGYLRSCGLSHHIAAGV